MKHITNPTSLHKCIQEGIYIPIIREKSPILHFEDFVCSALNTSDYIPIDGPGIARAPFNKIGMHKCDMYYTEDESGIRQGPASATVTEIFIGIDVEYETDYFWTYKDNLVDGDLTIKKRA